MGDEDGNIIRTPLPTIKLVALCFTLGATAVVATMLFSFIPYMVTDFGLTDKNGAGYYAGYIASSYFFCQSFTSVLWGLAADRIGRKPCLMMGVTGTMISTVLLGFSTNLYMAIGSRALGGLLSGNFPVAKSYLSDITDDTNRARAFSLISVAWGFGSLIGPVIGGFA